MKHLTNPRQLKALALVSRPDSVGEVADNTWVVRSQKGVRDYQVRKFTIGPRYKWECNCPDYQDQKIDCKHIYVVQLWLNQKDTKKTTIIQEEIHSEQPILCPFCHGGNFVKRGMRITHFGNTQRYGCKECGHRFTIDKGFRNMKHDPQIITLTLDLYFKGVSLRKIADHLTQFYGITVSQTTPMRWIKKYIKLLSKYVEQYKADVGNIWHSDETTILIRKEGMDRYYEWVWNVMDAQTRYLLVSQLTETKYVKDAQKPLRQAKERANRRPDAIVTDGLPAYRDAIKNEFYDPGALVANPHLRLKNFEIKPNNNVLERLNGTFRERTKILRGLDSSIGADEFLEGMRVYYNYIRLHEGIKGLTPAQMANIPINLNGNRWETMIGLAVK